MSAGNGWNKVVHPLESGHEQISQQRVDNLALLCHWQSQALGLRQLEALQLILQLVCKWLRWQLRYQKRQVQFPGERLAVNFKLFHDEIEWFESSQ